MLRTLFFEFPEDRTAWTVDDEYLFGSDLLVAPLFEDRPPPATSTCRPAAGSTTRRGRSTPAPPGTTSTPAPIPVVLLVRDHSVIPHVAVAQSTARIDWGNVELRVFSSDSAPVTGLFALPDGPLRTLRLQRGAGGYALTQDPTGGKVRWRVTRGGG